jgi:hypothetical protein
MMTKRKRHKPTQRERLITNFAEYEIAKLKEQLSEYRDELVRVAPDSATWLEERWAKKRVLQRDRQPSTIDLTANKKPSGLIGGTASPKRRPRVA